MLFQKKYCRVGLFIIYLYLEVIKLTINERILIAREKLNLTQSDFAERIGLKQAVIGLYENGKRNVTDRVINDICREFNINENWLRYGDEFGGMFNPSTNEEIEALGEKYNLDSDSIEFIKVFAELPETERKVMLDFFSKCANAFKTKKK
jgi:transcriptional regulator with XRE-family HTH domain